MRYFGTLGAVCGKQSSRKWIRHGPICARIRTRWREQDKGAIYDHGKDSGGFDCDPGDFLRGGGSAATDGAGAAGESVHLQRDGGREDCHGGELSASQRLDDDWISGNAAAAAGEG